MKTRKATTKSNFNIGGAYAKALLERLDIREVPDILSLARRLKIKVKEEVLHDCDGVLVRPKGTPRGLIAVNANIRSEGRKLFTIAHEIGHFILPGHEDAICSAKDIENWKTGGNERERQADEFAAELLIPSFIFKTIIAHSQPSLASIEGIATDTLASLSAAGWRYCDLTSERCAIVWSSKGKIVWAKKSDEFLFGLPRDKWIEKSTYAFDCFQDQSVPAQPQPVPADLWLRPDNLQSGAMIWEESRFLPNFDSVITLLWIKERVEKFSDFDDQEDSSLDPIEFSIHRTKWPT